jgi:hypothetical protein
MEIFSETVSFVVLPWLPVREADYYGRDSIFSENTPSKRTGNLRIARVVFQATTPNRLYRGLPMKAFSKNTHQNGPEISVLWEGNLYSEKHSSKPPGNLRIAGRANSLRKNRDILPLP